MPARIVTLGDRSSGSVPPDDPLAEAETGPETAVVLMPHGFPQDTGRLCQEILPRRTRYLGLLGPRSRAVRLIAELDEPLSALTAQAPVGLDIGAVTPQEIAIPSSPRALPYLKERPAGQLKHRDGPDHDPVLEAGMPLALANSSCKHHVTGRA